MVVIGRKDSHFTVFPNSKTTWLFGFADDLVCDSVFLGSTIVGMGFI